MDIFSRKLPYEATHTNQPVEEGGGVVKIFLYSFAQKKLFMEVITEKKRFVQNLRKSAKLATAKAQVRVCTVNK